MKQRYSVPDTAFASDEARRQRRFQKIPVRFLLPNIVTLLAVCSGVTAIRLGFEGRFELAVAAVILACILDAVDGRLARLLKGASKFGAELDSLADFVNFGVAPALLVYMWSLDGARSAGWIAALALAICCALRLARFNVAIDDPDKPAWKINFFTGIPAPAGAFLAMAPMYFGFLGFIDHPQRWVWLVLPWTLLVAAGMISRLPTYSGKAVGKQVRRDLVLPIVAGAVFVIALLISYPWEMLAGLAVVYVGLLPLAWRSHARQEAAWKARRTAAAKV